MTRLKLRLIYDRQLELYGPQYTQTQVIRPCLFKIPNKNHVFKIQQPNSLLTSVKKQLFWLKLSLAKTVYKQNQWIKGD